MANKIVNFLGLLMVSAMLLIISVALPVSIMPYFAKLILLLLAVMVDILAFSSRYYAYLLMPILKQRSRHIILSKEDAYWMATSADSILHRNKEDYIATVYISIPLYLSATEMPDEQKLEFSRQVSRLVGIARDPVRFTSQMYVMNKDSYIQQLRDAINLSENEEAELEQKPDASKDAIERVKGKTAMWRNLLDSISKDLSFELISYASVSGVGSKEYEAVSVAQQKARELMSGIGSIFGITPSIITGMQLKKFIEPDSLIPFSTVTEQINKNLEEEVI